MCRMRDVDSPTLTLGYEVPILTLILIFKPDAFFVFFRAVAGVKLSGNSCEPLFQVAQRYRWTRRCARATCACSADWGGRHIQEELLSVPHGPALAGSARSDLGRRQPQLTVFAGQAVTVPVGLRNTERQVVMVVTLQRRQDIKGKSLSITQFLQEENRLPIVPLRIPSGADVAATRLRLPGGCRIHRLRPISP